MSQMSQGKQERTTQVGKELQEMDEISDSIRESINALSDRLSTVLTSEPEKTTSEDNVNNIVQLPLVPLANELMNKNDTLRGFLVQLNRLHNQIEL